MAVLSQETIDQLEDRIKKELIPLFEENQYDKIDEALEELIAQAHKAIPDKKRISYGITYVVNLISEIIFNAVESLDIEGFEIAKELYEKCNSFRTICIGMGVISHYGLKDYTGVLPYFRHAASHEKWEVQEFTHMYLRKLTKKYPEEIQGFLLELTKSDNPKLRRFASESLRPVVENRWIHKNPEFSLKVLRELFEESDEYPRTSVGNNLSDLSGKSPELIFGIVEELVAKGNDDSYWIAHRACRNLVKKEPLRVMDILKIDEYVYKKKKYKRADFEYIN